MTAAVDLVKALGGGWDASTLPSGDALRSTALADPKNTQNVALAADRVVVFSSLSALVNKALNLGTEHEGAAHENQDAHCSRRARLFRLRSVLSAGNSSVVKPAPAFHFAASVRIDNLAFRAPPQEVRRARKASFTMSPITSPGTGFAPRRIQAS